MSQHKFITGLANIVLQLQKHVKQLGAYHLDALPALQSQRLQHQQNQSTRCLQVTSSKAICVATVIFASSQLLYDK